MQYSGLLQVALQLCQICAGCRQLLAYKLIALLLLLLQVCQQVPWKLRHLRA
jgi:hypothetical protein